MSDRILNDVFSVRGRFHRSVQIERDWQDQRGINDYLLTPTTRELSVQIAHGALGSQGPRAWSLTGPYGSGKSAFALFLTDFLASPEPQHEQARILRGELGLGTRPFAPVPIVGQRSSLAPELLAGLRTHTEHITQVAPLAEQVDLPSKNGNRALPAEFERTAVAARDLGYEGLLVIIDEFGKFLEHAARRPDTEDLQILQDLAETAARSEVPITLITILHSAFDEYLGPLDEARRMEWQKIQGRFADIAFLEPPQQFLRLIGAAIECHDSYSDICGRYSLAASRLAHSEASIEARRRIALEAVLPACAPLHPWTALLLWPLFRSKLAQNERSLFAFLVDRGPFGFQDFLSTTVVDLESPIFYSVDLLYEYVVTTLGPAAILGDKARRWAEIAHAVDRVPANAPSLAEAVVKTIGVVGLYGAPVGLKASREILGDAFTDQGEVSDSIDFLEQRSIIVYRKHEGAYGLWEGSDVNLDEAHENALYNVGAGGLGTRLRNAVALHTQVAKAHYIRSGTLRYFDVDVIDGSEESIKWAMQVSPDSADGRITYVLTANPVERNELIDCALDLTSSGEDAFHQLQLFAFPRPLVGLEKALLEVEAWLWVESNTQSLQGDPVAKSEVRSRIRISQRRLFDIAGPVLGLRGYLFSPDASEWIQAGRKHQVSDSIDFQKWLSRLCDQVFHEAPPLHNELLNRERLSSAATAARRSLIELMIEHEEEPGLGIQGTPAEYSMYRAMLAEGGFHRKVSDGWRFTAPGPEWLPIWSAIDSFLQTTKTDRRAFAELIELLKLPPFGLRGGPAPVLVCTYLLSRKNEIALYEDGLFVPELRIEVFERLTRVPEAFEVQRHRLTGSEQEAFAAVAEVLRSIRISTHSVKETDLLNIVRPLVMFAAELPDYSRRTKNIEPSNAIALRDALLNARDPYELVFRELPSAFGVELNETADVAKFSNRLRKALIGLLRAYPQLLDNMEQQIRDSFNLYGSSLQARQQLLDRATPLIGYASDRTLDLFVREVSRLDDRDWREVLARVINRGIPPTHWSDASVIEFQVRLRQLASDFARLEELVAEKHDNSNSTVFRVGWLDRELEEARAVIVVPPESRERVEELAKHIEAYLENEADGDDQGYRLRIAAIARVAQRYLLDPEDVEDE